MALSHKLELRQSQSLVMTPQLLQAIKLLQLSNLDLVAYVEAELERNPLLERGEESDGEGGAEERGEREAEGNTPAPDAVEGEGGEPPESEWLTAELETDAGEISAKMMDADLGNVFQDEPSRGPEETAPAFDRWSQTSSREVGGLDDRTLEAFVAEEKSLAAHLEDQLGLVISDPDLRLIGHVLINELDEDGYFRIDIGTIAERLGAGEADIERVLSAIQMLEPSGVGARNLGECLAIQLRDRDRFDPAMAALIAHLDLVARRDIVALRRLCGVDDDDLAEMLAEIRALDPRPGRAFGRDTMQTVVPDVMVRQGPDGGWLVELNAATLPRVLVNRTYFAAVAGKGSNAAEKAYITEALQNANWLVKSLDQRARTILKVSTEIVRQQDAFLAEGVQHLRPLNLKTVAEAIGMHESTVSRVTSNKYMATSRGTFELKYFFTAAISSTNGAEAHSAEAVRHRIRRLIDDEQANAVLSDDVIVKALRDNGIDIARRTVAKYREAMRIPSSVERRRDKAALVRNPGG
jgi:RNA polymerase sigma-54 factor